MDLLAHADAMRVTVRHIDDLDTWGLYCAQTHTIHLRSGMGTVQWRTTLAHELGHAHWGHTMTCPKTERQADEYAARLLIPPTRWEAATTEADTVEALSQELLVLPNLVRVAAQIYSPQESHA
ncbi:ImmA/IrrE family metallo-endopeptidase [Nesterenkonia sp. K-15-9-6]|uniref:ImmA/IrrE family metallo-endopeptidase n=1 Tax=Nesterenkonia sp. K-15-9-6 TaxID=3093918 RepID=UPI0040448018